MTCAVMTRRQVSNGQLRTCGIRPECSYHWWAMPGDRVRVQVVIEAPFDVESFEAMVTQTEHHGHYKLVGYRRCDTGEDCSGWLYSAGPPDWGIVEFRVIEAARRPRPVRDDVLGERDLDDMLCCLGEPTRCPRCGSLYNWIPKSGWPCIECRLAVTQMEGE